VHDCDVMLVAGARPNFVKLAALYRALSGTSLRVVCIHTGQHYDDAMSGAFFRDLGIPDPHVNLGVGPGSHGQQTGTIMIRFEPLMHQFKPRWVVVFGDVNSTVACALVAAKAGVRVAHVEAGLRSHDWTMPEEINRVVTDRLSDRLYTPSQEACSNLQKEGIDPRRVLLVGNIMVDTLMAQLPHIDRQRPLDEFDLQPRRYTLVTLHRPSNVDDPVVLRRICHVLGLAAQRESVLFPAHPRTIARLRELELIDCLGGTRIIPPLPYQVFLALMASARVVVTDSGGVQEETTALGIPCLTLRPNTERPITITQGTNQLVEPDPDRFLELHASCNGRKNRVPEFWDGKTAQRIAQDLATLTPSESEEHASGC
jgi:UDP-N-acetylglucosamine 2-epimerase (non-hydrolysing)